MPFQSDGIVWNTDIFWQKLQMKKKPPPPCILTFACLNKIFQAFAPIIPPISLLDWDQIRITRTTQVNIWSPAHVTQDVIPWRLGEFSFAWSHILDMLSNSNKTNLSIHLDHNIFFEMHTGNCRDLNFLYFPQSFFHCIFDFYAIAIFY